jgi:uncharacterized protein (TIGR02646 family)
MKKFSAWAAIDGAIQQKLDAIAVDQRSKAWDGQRRAVLDFKEMVHTHGMEVQQKRCAWCTLLLGEDGRRTSHRDHIAPKGLYPQWTFTSKNLILACEYCNGFAVKADLDTVEHVAEAYDEYDFLIVHPYLDDPKEHISYAGDDPGESIVIVGTSDKGRWTITNLKLDSPGLTKERAKDYLYLERSKALPPYYKELLDRATGRKGVP